MIYFMDFNLNEFNSDSFKNAYLDFRISNSEFLQKDIIEKTGIAATTFKRAKTNGFSTNPKVYDALAKFFDVSIPSAEAISLLEKECNTLFTYIYFNNAKEQQNCYERLMKIYDITKGSHLEVLTIALLSIAMNASYYKEDLRLLTNNSKMIESLITSVNGQNKVLLTYSLYEYSLHLQNLKMAVHYSNMIEPLISIQNPKLGCLMNYAVMNACFFSRDFLKGIIYANKVLEYQNICYSPVIRVSCIYILTTFYSMLKDHDKIIATAENEILGLQFDEEHQLQYFSMLSALITAYIAKERYTDGKKLIDVLRRYDLSAHPSINKAYYPTLKGRQDVLDLIELFVYLKERNTVDFTKVKESILKEENEERIIYVQMLSLLANPNKANIKKLGSMLQARSDESMLLYYANIHYLIKNEYDKIKY